MFLLRRLYVTVTILAFFLTAEGADKYTDENRPYEFGFNIDGEQHRHEKKDENGLIMGEFGFITADGVYHVTVYATDENGNFKILSMKNIRTKPYPTAPERKGNSLPFPPPGSAPQYAGPVAQQPVSLEPPVKACSHCSIPTTAKPPQLTDFAVVSGNPVSQYPQSTQQNYPLQNYPQQNDFQKNYPQPGNLQNYPQENYSQQNNPLENYKQQNYPQGNYPQQKYPQENYPQQNDPQENFPQQNYPQESYPRQSGQDYAGQGEIGPQYPEQNSRPGDREPKQFNNFLPQGSSPIKPTLISAQMQIVDKNTDIHQIGPGEHEGLPNGLNTNDMYDLLYTFNYTVGFHGHHEEGYRNGAKKGYYYITGRNGIRTRVDYEADEKGFRPKITEEVLDVLSDDVPKPETEKDEKYGLKGYEFKWLYYPSESNRR